MNILIAGLGSIGQRHQRLLLRAGHDVRVVSRRASATPKAYADVSAALNDFRPDLTIIATETSAHSGLLDSLQNLRCPGMTLVEKPLFADSRECTTIASGEPVYVAYNLRFHPALQWLRRVLAYQLIESVNVRCGQYLPTWRPARDYARTYSASRAQGGGVLRDLSHELDYTLWLFGAPLRLTANGGRRSTLNIDVEDAVDVLMETERSRQVHVHINYLDRLPSRLLVVNTATATYRLDLIKGIVERSDGEPLHFQLEPDSTYLAMYDAVFNRSSDLATYAEGARLVRMIEAVELCCDRRCWKDFA